MGSLKDDKYTKETSLVILTELNEDKQSDDKWILYFITFNTLLLSSLPRATNNHFRL